jgi:hypothetical protein
MNRAVTSGGWQHFRNLNPVCVDIERELAKRFFSVDTTPVEDPGARPVRLRYVKSRQTLFPAFSARRVCCEFYALNGPKGSLVGRRPAADHGAHGPSMNPATSPLKSRRRTLQGVLRERLPQIEATLKAGYRMRTIVEQLAQEGFHTTLGAFRDGLYRARLWRKTYGPLNLPLGDPPPVTSARHVEGPPPQAVPRLGPAAPVLTPEELKKRAGFQYEGTANLKKDDLV